MKTRYFLLSLAAAGLLASCEKELPELAEQTPDVSDVKTVLSVGIDPSTRTYLGEGEGSHKVYWSNGDQIAVNGVASDELTGLEENAERANFTLNGLLDLPYKIVYPASRKSGAEP